MQQRRKKVLLEVNVRTNSYAELKLSMKVLNSDARFNLWLDLIARLVASYEARTHHMTLYM
jgi:hypothetical protein